ncbi:MAG: YihY/virulence factor BrkB family protein [Prochlorotrichaceae cyanobacterium]|jgi:membrane protein
MNAFLQFCFRGLKILRWILRSAGEKRLTGLASEIAFNATLSLFPTILALLAAIDLVAAPSRPAVRQMASRLSEIAPVEVVTLVQNFVENDYTISNSRLISLGFVFAIWISSNAMATSMVALDQIQQTPFEKRRPFWKNRSIAILLTLVTLSLYIVASVVAFASEFLIRYLALRVELMGTVLLALWWMLAWPIALSLVTSAFALVYRFGPSRCQRSTPILPGAFLAALSWVGISFLFRNYVLIFGRYRQVYGALGAAIVLMLWLYLSALVMLLGNQFNVTLAKHLNRW